MSDSRTDLLMTKLDDYSTQNKNNYVASGEITVTITLNEYRKLVEENVVADSTISKVRLEKYDLEKRLKETTDKVKELTEQIHAIYAGHTAACEGKMENNNV